MQCNTQGEREPGRLTVTWRRTVQMEIREESKTKDITAISTAVGTIKRKFLFKKLDKLIKFYMIVPTLLRVSET